MSSCPPNHPYDERLSDEEFTARLEILKEHAGRDSSEETIELARWFLRRYPTLVERCRYSTRKFREWTAGPKIPPEKIR
jgi:hypothetical protein